CTGQPQVQMILEKHVYEHLSVHARNEAERQFGLTPELKQQMQQSGQPMPPELENLVAKLQVQYFKEHQQKYPPKDPSQNDPVVALKNRELDIKEQDNAVKHQQNDQQMQMQDQQHDEKLALQAEMHEDKMEMDGRKLQVQAQAARRRPAGGGG